ncbi:glycosyltransferase [Viridibacterium curvum]|uniref:Glycosyltransferase n=1 Tax=Viridibacterium curvum TaxID=1101404 RepID=A0ABP9QB22_9RHOO
MRILLVIPTVFGGGAEQVAAVLSRAWSDGHEVSVIAWQAAGESLDFGVPVQFTGLGVQSGLWRKLRNVWRRVQCLRQARKAQRADVVMAFMDEAGFPAIFAGLLDGQLSRLIVSIHHNPRWLPAWRRALLALLYRLPGRVVAVSAGVRDELVAGLHLPAARVTNIPNPLSSASVDDPVSQSLAARLRPGYLLAVGRLDLHTKGLDLLLDAWAGLPAGRPRLVIVGEGGGRAWLEAEIARRNVQGEVLLPGWVRDPSPFYANALALVSASRFEGWSNVLMEAMGQACPVVATRCPHGPAEILGEGFADWLVPSEDVMALRAAMLRMLAMPESARAALGEAMRLRVQQFDVSVIAPRWLALAGQMQGASA